MKRRTTKVALSIFAIAIASIFVSEFAIGDNNGPSNGRTGSPKDGSNCTNCHSGTATSANGLITSTVPAAGYTAGTKYTFTATIANPGTKGKWGFQISPQNNAGTLLGTLVVTNTTNTQLKPSSKYIEHTSAGNKSSSWSFDWTAPASGTGDVTFYGAFLIGDNFNNTSGDQVQTSTLLVHENSCTAPTITKTTPASLCGVGTATLTATATAGTINWYAAATGGTSLGTGTSFTTPSISTTTTYYVDATNTCTTATRTAVTASVTATPTITGTTPGSTCGTGTVLLKATASAGTINWYAAATGGASLGTGTSFVTPSISATTTYYVDATSGSCTSASRTAIDATVNAAPTITNPLPASRCDAGTVALGATASIGTCNWYAASTGGTSLGTGSSFTTPSISTTTTYYVDATNGGCTSARTSIVATIGGGPTITNSSPATLCGVGTATLTATASAGTLNWYAAATGGASLGTGTSFVTPSISTTTTYYVDATSGGCTSARSAVIASINAIPTATISGIATVCSGATSKINIALTGKSPWNFTYASATASTPVTGITTTTYTTNVTAGTYTISSVSDANNCTGTSSGSATVVQNTPISVSTSTFTCNGSNTSYTVEFDISGGSSATYTVTGGGTLTGSHFTSSAINSGASYSLTVNDANKCSSVTVSGSKNCSCAATAKISGGGTICSGNVATVNIALTGLSPWSFVYSINGIKQPKIKNQTNSAYSFTTTTTGTYTLDSIYDANCIGSTSGTATVSQTLPTATISGGGTVCAGTSANLNFAFTGTSPWSYSYSDGTNTSNSTSVNASVSIPKSTAGIYSIVSVSDASCSGSGSGTASIVVNALPNVGITISSSTVCAGSSVTLTGTGASTYVWINGPSTTIFTDSPANTTTYTVTGTDANNCSNKATMPVTVKTCNTSTITASVVINSSTATICSGGVITFTATPINGGTSPSYLWHVNSNYAGTNSPVFSTAGLSLISGDVVTVTMTSNLAGVTGSPATSNSLAVTVNATPSKPTITRPNPGNLLVSSSATGNLWYYNGLVLVPNVTTQNFTLTESSATGNYAVKVVENGCSSVMSDAYNIINTAVTEFNNNNAINISPNPNDGNFIVSLDIANKANYTIEVKNVLGENIYQENLGNFSGIISKQINISNVGAGVYLINVTSNQGTFIKKIIVY